MPTIADLADLATLGSPTVKDLNKHTVRALALFIAASRHIKVEWQANGTAVALLSYNGGEYGVTVDGVKCAEGTLGALLDTVKQLSAVLEVPPTPTARPYEQWGFWADMQDGHLVHYPMYNDGGWDEEPTGVEFACQHLIDRVNADFGTAFTLDDFEEDCNCAD